jgi:hypothetical protein
MTEMTRAVVVVQTTAATELAILQYAHPGVKEATDFALHSDVACDLHD